MAKFDFKKASMKALGLGAGATAAVMIDRFPMVGSLDPKIRASIKIALGVALPAVVKSDIMTSIGDGMIAVGSNQLVASFTPAVQGIGDVYGEDDGVYGEGDEYVSGTDTAINGVDEE
jgi:O-succinylbenzoate synthase